MMFNLLFTLSLLFNVVVIVYLFSARKKHSAFETKGDNKKVYMEDNVQDCSQKIVSMEPAEQVLAAISTTSGTDDIAYFKTEKDKLFFLLNEVDGKRRNQLLGITTDMYNDEKLSKQWFKSISNKVHPDKNPHDPRAAAAFNNLKKLHSLMTL